MARVGVAVRAGDRNAVRDHPVFEHQTRASLTVRAGAKVQRALHVVSLASVRERCADTEAPSRGHSHAAVRRSNDRARSVGTQHVSAGAPAERNRDGARVVWGCRNNRSRVRPDTPDSGSYRRGVEAEFHVYTDTDVLMGFARRWRDGAWIARVSEQPALTHRLEVARVRDARAVSSVAEARFRTAAQGRTLACRRAGTDGAHDSAVRLPSRWQVRHRGVTRVGGAAIGLVQGVAPPATAEKQNASNADQTLSDAHVHGITVACRACRWNGWHIAW